MNKRIQIYILTIFISSCTFAEKVSSVCIPDSTVFNDILNCYLADYKKNDKILNSLYQKKISTLSKENKKKLRDSQREWVKKKEIICVADESEYGRESHFEAIECQTEMTKERISFLKKY
ncbi:hypothetical protein BFR77_00390 [Acinetobacter pittii]|uniref:lysozyme inhibitor LprI family protein n=1 Tax=Acinetobacter pittii TaxID=48296 RepID=UPI000838F1B4|nr:lysozyme inhibitor LprI family protein [Acinetobacter pittii]MBJ9935702.1 DUF1311 domain-containing protein [Acinetobacter pittii]MBN6527684.1 DUF1311 domain-containing protein [Acinetobacter pittii]MBN6536471.1 DUF1311 domain-containing protein [Acinetobacter pittii]MDX8156355.1 lysozyme inhibitor LprI family protein [Acinetobacter pittii]MEB6671268.1 DUF1311 domain-containing protein [Acinetobacter pittii]